MRVEQEFETLKALGDPLDVIHPVDAEHEMFALNAQALQHRAVGLPMHFRDARKRDRGRKRLHERAMILTKHRKMLEADARFYFVPHGVDKVVAILLRMKSDKVCAKHAFED